MATQEKLVKSLDSLKSLLSSNLSSDSFTKKKDKIIHCNVIGDALCNSSVKIAPNFPNLLSSSIEILLQLCDDAESDIRMVADENLNRIIRAMTNGNIIKVQLEFYNEIKKNGAARSLRAALWRFAQLCYMIRPQKGKAYVQNLVPCIVNITQRTEEPLLETLASSLSKIMEALGCFTTDNHVKCLLKAFLQNISNNSAVIRRTSSACILTVCIHCRKPHVFISYILNILLDLSQPATNEQSIPLILGILGCLRNILPHVKQTSVDYELKGSFGVKRSLQDETLNPNKMIQVYELCLTYIAHTDHNVINAALETLNTLLLNAPTDLINTLLSPEGISKNRTIAAESGNRLKRRSLSQISIATTKTTDESILVDNEVTEIKTDIEKWIQDSKLPINKYVPATNVTNAPTESTGDEKSNNFNAPTENFEYSNMYIGTIESTDDYVGNVENIIERIEDIDVSDGIPSEKSSPKFINDTVAPSNASVIYEDIDVGSFTDTAVPLEYCCRYISKSFLLTGHPNSLVPDKNIRISVKSLALSCISSVTQYYPNILVKYLDKNGAKETVSAKNEKKYSKQQISDILLFINHSDPQLRGNVCYLIGNFIKSVLINSQSDFNKWLALNSVTDNTDAFQLNHLMKLLLLGLQDESSTCSRLSLMGIEICLKNMIESVNSLSVLPVLNLFPTLVKNPYWLVKVKLVEIVCEISFISLQHITGNNDFQEKIIHEILLPLLQDEDQRVRHATAVALVSIIPKLYNARDNLNQSIASCKAISYKNSLFKCSLKYPVDINVQENKIIKNLPIPYNKIGNKADYNTEKSLSRIVNYLTQNLLSPISKHSTYGITEALCVLSNEYVSTVYSQAWNCARSCSITKENYTDLLQRSLSQMNDRNVQPTETILNSSSELLNTCVTLLTNTTVSHEINCHQWLLNLTGNIYAGVTINNLEHTNQQIEPNSKYFWDMYSDKLLSDVIEQFLHHVVRLLNIFCHIIDEAIPTLPPTKPVLPNLPTTTSLSPMKRRSKGDVTDKSRTPSMKHTPEKDDKNEKKTENSKFAAMGYFANLPHYMKFYEVLKMAYSNYKITLDSDASEKFLQLLKTALETLSQILEMASVYEIGRIAEELLYYMRSTVILEPTATIQCVLQLLKCLFGTNLCLQINEVNFRKKFPEEHRTEKYGFYYDVFHSMYGSTADIVNMIKNANKTDKDGDHTVMGYLHRKDRKQSSNFKTFSRNADKTALANYISLFEPMVIKALKQYTITCDVRLQCKVLQLLSHLVQLRVNYCLLDSDQIFILFVLKQMEFIEEGQIILAEELIPRIFQFLVHLSYEKQHSKMIMSVPKIIQLCDGLMASGQSPVTHFIPAIIPVIEDIFVFRNQNTALTDLKELETTREVLFSMLLRLVEYHEVLNLLAMVVNESRYCNDNGERWNRWSKQISEILLLMLAQGRVRLETSDAQDAVQNLIFSINLAVFKPINSVLRVLFIEPPQKSATIKQVNRWIGMITTLLLIISQEKEDILFIRILEEQTEFSPSSVLMSIKDEIIDPLNVSNVKHYLDCVPPKEIFARLIFQVIIITSEKCSEIFKQDGNCDNYIFEQFSTFLMYCVHMFQSGSHCKIANSAIELMSEDTTDPVPINTINDIFINFAPFCPILTLQWCYVLTLLNYNVQEFWSKILQTPKTVGIVHVSPNNVNESDAAKCINLEIVRVGGTILYSDYLCEYINDAEQLTWLIVNHIEYIIRLSNELSVTELISAVHRNTAASGLFIQAIGARCQDIDEPCFIKKLLKCVENAHPSQSGALLLLLIPRLLNCRQLSLSRHASILASRRTELLLTMSAEEVTIQLPKADFDIIVDNLLKSKLIKKHETLVSLLNRLGSQCYDLSPIEFDQRRSLNPENIKNIVINKAWYLSQVKIHCNQTTYSGKESAQLLNKLDYEDMITLMSNIDFNNAILKNCLTFMKMAVKMGDVKEEVPLLKALAVTVLKHIANIKSLIPKPHQVYKPIGRDSAPSELKYTKKTNDLFSDNIFWQAFSKQIPIITCYLETLPHLPHIKVPDNHCEDFAKFGVLCLESLVYQIREENILKPHFADSVLYCANIIFKQQNFCTILGIDSHSSWLCSAVNSIYHLVQYLLTNSESLPDLTVNGLETTLKNIESLSAGHSCYQLSVLITWLERSRNTKSHIPDFMMKNMTGIIISLSRLPLVNSYVLTPPTAWRQGWMVELTGTYNTYVPLLPIEFLQEIDILEEFIYRITLLGWTSRQQFEETWMCLLSVLSSSPREDSMPDEINAMIHTTSLAVQSITALLLQTLLEPMPGNPHLSKMIHVPRDSDIDHEKGILNKLYLAHESLYWKYQEYFMTTSIQFPLMHVFNRPNFERIYNNDYAYSQLSVEYLWIATKTAESKKTSCKASDIFETRQKYLNESGLDLHSCLQFLLDLYSQWMKPQNNTPIKLLHEVVRSVLAISDIFTEKSQFSWMLEVCLNLSKTHPIEDDILHQYLVIGTCKATAILTPDLETYDLVKKLVMSSVKSTFLPTRIASLHGMMYLLQSSIIGNTIIGGQSEETMLIHALAIDYVQNHIHTTVTVSQSEEHQLTMWALAFFLLENVEEQINDSEIVPSVLQVVLNTLSQPNLSTAIHNALMQGLERLVVKKCITGKASEQITKIALKKLKSSNPNYALPGLQLLISCMYMGCQEQFNEAELADGLIQSDPELFVQMIEKISSVFDRIKKSCPFEVELLCSVLPNMLIDFFPPSEILTKVIGEFLSPQQPHQKLLSGIVFLVFERACEQQQLMLLQDWVVCSLSNFTQSLPVGMATWCLTCFFISASTNVWLRSLFPHIQSRIGRYEYEDKKMLCIAGADFYRSLSNDNQRKSFIDTFNKVKDQPGTPFKDLIACL